MLVDGIPISEYNVKWLRSQIGLVSQEPVLFGVSIAENISYGRENVSTEDIMDAARKANAHDFIVKFPKVKFNRPVFLDKTAVQIDDGWFCDGKGPLWKHVLKSVHLHFHFV